MKATKWELMGQSGIQIMNGTEGVGSGRAQGFRESRGEEGTCSVSITL